MKSFTWSNWRKNKKEKALVVKTMKQSTTLE